MLTIYQTAMVEIQDIVTNRILCIPLKDIKEVVIGGNDEYSSINGIKVNKEDAEIMRKIFLGMVPFKQYAIQVTKIEK